MTNESNLRKGFEERESTLRSFLVRSYLEKVRNGTDNDKDFQDLQFALGCFDIENKTQVEDYNAQDIDLVTNENHTYEAIMREKGFEVGTYELGPDIDYFADGKGRAIGVKKAKDGTIDAVEYETLPDFLR